MKRIFFYLLILPLFFSSCAEKRSLPKHPSELRLSLPEDPVTLDPRKGGDATSSTLQFMLFEGLTKFNPDGSVSLGQCSSVHISPDQKTYTFRLGNTKWSNGKPVTSYDFERAWKAILSPSFPSPNAHLLYPILYAEEVKKGDKPMKDVGIAAPDPSTLIITLERETPYFLNLVSFCVFFPIPSGVETDYPDWAFHGGPHFVSNGPFILEDWKHNNEIILKKNPLYHDPSQVHLDQVHISIIRSEQTAFELYQRGDLDLIGPPFSSIPLDARLIAKNQSELLVSPSAVTTFITFNIGVFPFSNAHLRKALGLAIDRKEIVENVTHLDETAAFCAVPPALKPNGCFSFYQDAKKELATSYLNKALEELSLSKKELESFLTYFYPQSELNHKVAQVLQEQWRETLGLHVKLSLMDKSSHTDLLSKKKHLFSQSLYRAQYADPMNILERFKYKQNVKNYSSWEHPLFQSLLDLSFKESGQKRMALLEKAEGLLLEEAAIAPLFHSNLCYLIKPDIENIQLSPLGGLFFERLKVKQQDP